MQESERIWKYCATWKRSKRCSKIVEKREISQNPRKSSISTIWKCIKIRVLTTSRWYFAKNIEFHVRNAFGYVQVTLCTKRRNFMDFDPKIYRIHAKCRKLNVFGCNSRPGSVQKHVQKQLKNAKYAKIHENPRCVPYPTKMHENSRFEHVQVTFCKK